MKFLSTFAVVLTAKRKKEEFKRFQSYVTYVAKEDPAHVNLIIKTLAEKYSSSRQLALMMDCEKNPVILPGNEEKCSSWVKKNPEKAGCVRPYKLGSEPVITNVWNRLRLVSNIQGIGEDVGNPFIQQEINHYSNLIYPIGLLYVYNGNHSANAAILKDEGEITPTGVIDWRILYEEDDLFFDGICFQSKLYSHHR